MNSRYFSKIFDREFDIVSEAHGRVNLIGEHTDYNGGFVLPTSIPQKTTATMAKRNDSLVRFVSANSSQFGVEPSEYRLGEERPEKHWTDYGKGVTWLLQK